MKPAAIHYDVTVAARWSAFANIWWIVSSSQGEELMKRILRGARANQRANDLKLCICQAAVTSAVGTNIDDMALKAPFNDVGNICKYNLDVSQLG